MTGIRKAVCAAICLIAVACSDSETSSVSNRETKHESNVVRLVFSSLRAERGNEVTARLEVTTLADVKPIGSYTARVAYDTASLELLAEEPATSDAMQVINPLPGDARIAGISRAGFVEGHLVTLRFRARRDGSIGDAFATLTEMHAVDRSDVLSLLSSPRVAAQLDTR